jgi:hypothetical protein
MHNIHATLGQALAFLVVIAAGATSLGQDLSAPGTCPFQYEEQPLDDIATGAVDPYLYGGIYNRPNCPNCQAAGLWASFCGRRPVGLARYDNQLCSKSTVKILISRLLQQGNTGALTLTPCKLWNFMQGRTTWIVG